MPVLVVQLYSGGAHCCSTYQLLGLSKHGAVLPLASIDSEDSECEFRDLDGDAVAECRLRDCTFRYWNACFACSPFPEIILRWNGNAFELATDLMAKPPPSDAALAAQGDELRAAHDPARHDDRTIPPPEYWGTMLDLIYAGNADSAWRFAELAWPPELENRDEFLESFRSQLESGPYWPELRPWNDARRVALQRSDDEIATHKNEAGRRIDSGSPR